MKNTNEPINTSFQHTCKQCIRRPTYTRKVSLTIAYSVCNRKAQVIKHHKQKLSTPCSVLTRLLVSSLGAEQTLP